MTPPVTEPEVFMAVYAAVCLGLVTSRTGRHGVRRSWGWLRDRAWVVALLAMAIAWYRMWPWDRLPEVVALAAAGLALVLRPRIAGTVLSLFQIGLGLHGFWAFQGFVDGTGAVTLYNGSYGSSAAEASVAMAVDYALLGAGTWMLWRTWREDSPTMLRIEVGDNGTGGADPAKGTGLAGIERRLGAFDGSLAVSSPPGGPTMIIMEVPCALSSPRISSC